MEVSMTYGTRPLHPLDELYDACKRYPGGMEALATRLQIRSVKTLYKKLSPTATDFHLGYPDELDAVLRCLEEGRVADWDSTIHAFCWRHGGVFVRLPEEIAGSEALGRAAMQVLKEAGDVVARTDEAMEGDQLIDSREFLRIDREFEQLMAAVAGWREQVRARHQEARDKGLVR
jgi:hypothetical protein